MNKLAPFITIPTSAMSERPRRRPPRASRTCSPRRTTSSRRTSWTDLDSLGSATSRSGSSRARLRALSSPSSSSTSCTDRCSRCCTSSSGTCPSSKPRGDGRPKRSRISIAPTLGCTGRYPEGIEVVTASGRCTGHAAHGSWSVCRRARVQPLPDSWRGGSKTLRAAGVSLSASARDCRCGTVECGLGPPKTGGRPPHGLLWPAAVW